MTITAVILTFNESKHIRRCLVSLEGVADRVLIIDSHSTDNTQNIARSQGAEVIEHPWNNYASQYNWGLEKVGRAPDPENDWILRIDADEYLTKSLATQIVGNIGNVSPAVHGIFIPRRMAFQGRLIRHGGVFPIQIIRLFRNGKGRCEERWMDEHIKIAGETVSFKGELIDDNLNSLTWWTTKHNAYASREVVDLLNLEFGFMPHETVASLNGYNQTSVKRWIKEKIYSRLPGGFRAFAYFFYRYVIRFGFLDGKEGAAFHFLQGFWYRFLVDAKLYEVRKFMIENDVDVVDAIDQVLGIKIR